jgi:hypothetical protein
MYVDDGRMVPKGSGGTNVALLGLHDKLRKQRKFRSRQIADGQERAVFGPRFDALQLVHGLVKLFRACTWRTRAGSGKRRGISMLRGRHGRGLVLERCRSNRQSSAE